MTYTFSKMFPLETKAPDFELLDTVSDKHLSLQQLKSDKLTVIMFICNHCPYVIRINDEIVKLAKEYIPLGVNFIAISSNDAEAFPDDSPSEMKKKAHMLDYPFPYLYDETQKVAKAYMAACTPDFYIFDEDLSCVYRGQMDDSRYKSDLPVTGTDLRKALDLGLDGKTIPENEQKPSGGCNIKWKNGISPF